MAKPTHIHLYKRVNLSRTKGAPPYNVFRCMKPMCNHYIRVELALGKLCECNRCHEPMIIDKETVQLAKPHCQDCIKRKKADIVGDISAFLGD